MIGFKAFNFIDILEKEGDTMSDLISNRKKKRGRPIVGEEKRDCFKLRMSDTMAARLNNLSIITGKSRSDIIREAFDEYEKTRFSQDYEPYDSDDY